MTSTGPIKRDDIDTARGDDSSGREAGLTTATLSTIGHRHPANQGPAPTPQRQYRAPMATMTTAAVIAAALRNQLSERITYLPDRKLHALLYLAQLTALTNDDQPLFLDEIKATESGVTVGDLTQDDKALDLTSTQFSIVTGIVAHYAGLPTTDLEALIRGQQPWQTARASGSSEITQASMRTWVRGFDDDPNATVMGVTRLWLAATRAERTSRDTSHDRQDSAAERAHFIADIRSKM